MKTQQRETIGKGIIQLIIETGSSKAKPSKRLLVTQSAEQKLMKLFITISFIGLGEISSTPNLINANYQQTETCSPDHTG